MKAATGITTVSSVPDVELAVRVGAAAMAVFLMLNGLELQASEPELVATMLAVASGE